MLFNSFNFAIFLPLVLTLYWIISSKHLKVQNILLLISSYFFYACWDWKFLFLLIFSTSLDYLTGIQIAESNNERIRRFWLWLSIAINLGFLGIFKYYDFFAQSFSEGLLQLGFHVNPWTLNLILPVGISFYTFHGLSYVIDIYHKKIQAERNIVDYSLFVSFFPLLVAGPIERATHLLPQIQKKREFNYNKVTDGLKQILWGLFKKMVIADNCAYYADLIFNNSENHSGSTLLVGAVLFSFQIYGDFSGYSDIALGTARVFGIELLQNFAFPYFSRDISEFWRRWHISLTTWFRDYIYIPLGGNRVSILKKIRNTFIIFLVSGFWHGANWTFIFWGALNALFFLPLLLTNRNRLNLEIVAKHRIFPNFIEFINIVSTFLLCTFTWIFFRSENINQAVSIIITIFSTSIVQIPEIFPFYIIILLIFFIAVEWLGREGNYAIENIVIKWKRPIRWAYYSALLFLIGMFMQTEETAFIYFQF